MPKDDARVIYDKALKDALPDQAVRQALKDLPEPKGRLLLLAVGKAAWQMAKEAKALLNDRIDAGMVITKDGHVQGEIPGISCYEAGHPVPDARGVLATEKALTMVQGLQKEDLVIFLLSGGGSALFEKPLLPLERLRALTEALLASGAAIHEINAVRKRFSAVKAGRFGLACAPARVEAIVLSDVLGDPLDTIASGPAYPDSGSAEEALEILERYQLPISREERELLFQETAKALPHVHSQVMGSVKQLCASAEASAKQLGYDCLLLCTSLDCEAKEAGRFLAAIAKEYQGHPRSLAIICGGETVVRLTGNGKGGRNQELALSAARGLSSCQQTCLFSIGSDGTDGPTDAAGGVVDEHSAKALEAAGYEIADSLAQNNSYPALKAIDALIMTGPTGTNVNDLTVLLIKR